ncbi:NADH dehydrogenase subunit 3 (mitochondrion) [Helicoverpa armigera]|uniref:NADH-ubiquinone oxidoreductase chain 3 n=5 Tax=Helicoverpa TaxID=7112 RepID=E3T2E1_HELAM|nr:NADH dehydrogenase subunit 3 [Helicoverpa armigera]YP_010303494.1 NADH dehydrogenase subunit 3 [Helicoverpa zea]AZL93582.1 NADH dehydrogenase subunit 3 [Helicoverpa armigera armigera]AZL93634.1 NADH dehydrogenase subunit 3 [Helicoverpa armigera conferta]ACZ83043.1 NADH dehydrogenase subunit 3 [Helicoverpa armigera]AIR76336.1 NADH dehydrogenase subunit 3 [Helicoverpa zea]AZL93595.1 NADH dehydrogenase subunit 3 [Helicoverpa armigera armigera]
MILMLNIFTIIMMISNIMMFLSIIISKKTYMDREKCSPFECGFDPKSSARIPFSLHFFLITVIFLIFDVEIALIFPIIKLFKLVNFFLWTKISFFFILILLIGLYHEWNQNMLNWTN